jgi:hypothetical protein
MDSIDRIARAAASDKLLAVYVAWKQLTAGRMGPKRSEITPAVLGRAIYSTFFVDVVDDGADFRFGFTGDKVMQFLEKRCAAPTVAGLRGDHFFDAAEELFRKCMASRKPLVSGPYPTRYRGKEHLERQVLLLPLSDDGENVTALLGAFDTWQLGTNAHRYETVMAE